MSEGWAVEECVEWELAEVNGGIEEKGKCFFTADGFRRGGERLTGWLIGRECILMCVDGYDA